MVLKTNHIATLTLFIVVYNCYASNDRLSIERRVYGDTFENPTCSDNSGCSWYICSNLNADCDSYYYCQHCICKNTHKTFVPWIGKWGSCVKDDYLLFFPVGNSSFMVQDAQTPSVCISGDHYTQKTVCDSSILSQRWIWTQDNQLWNVATSRCLQQDGVYGQQGEEYLYLQKCNVATKKQKWTCSSHKRFRLLKLVSDRYMSYYSYNSNYVYIIVSSKSSDKLRVTWQRFQSGENLCSVTTAGCNGFTGSSVFAADINCKNCYSPKRINVPTDSINNTCFIVWNQLQFLDYNKWTQLPFTEKIFGIYKSSGITYLKLDFTNASSRWTGLIVKLHFYCPQSQLTPPSNTRCVLIKFIGTANYPTAAPPKVPSTPIATAERSTTTTTTKTTTDTTTKISTSAATVTDASTPKGTPESKTDGIFPLFLSSHPTTSRPQTDSLSSTASLPNIPNGKRHTGESSNVVLIVVPLVIVILVFCGILVGLVIYKKRRRPVKASQNETKDSNDKGGSSVRQTSVDTLNPIYSPADNSFAPHYSDDGGVYQEPTSGASQVCDLYESGGDHDHDYAKVDQNDHRAPVPEETYDYANSNDIRPVAQPNSINKKTPKHACESKVEGEENTCPLYQTLEDSSANGLEMSPITNNNKKDPNESNVEGGGENMSPVYQTLEDPYENE